MRLPLAALALVALAAALRSAPEPARVPLTTSRVTGSPEPPPPYRSRVAFPKLKFTRPLHLRPIPGANRWVMVEQGGKLWSFSDRPDADKPDLFLDAPKELKSLAGVPNAKGFEHAYAIAFHPKFPAVREAFLAYTLSPKQGKNLADGSRVSRFRVTETDPPRLDPASEEVVLTWLQGGHNGCDLAFGPDGMLYVSTGDAEDPSPPDRLHTGQDISDLLSSVLRIDVDRRDAGKNYAVPPDNPFVGARYGAKPARPEVWAYGFRNPWRMSFDRAGGGDLWVGDVGWEQWEMIHRVPKGYNGGWSIREAGQSVHPDDNPGPTPPSPPAVELSHALAASITGGYVYRGTRFPELVGAYVFGDWETRRVWGARFGPDGRLASLPELVPPAERIITFAEGPDAELYWVDYDTGTIHTPERNPAAANDTSANYPKKLSDTGLFSSVRDRTPAPGVVPFTVSQPQWQDHAAATHWLALPGTGVVRDYADKRPIPGLLDWRKFRFHFPTDGVLVKTLTLETERGKPETAKPVETQILHWDGVDWRPTTYAWRDDGSDADLVPAAGAEKVLRVKDDRHAGGVREQVWTYAGRAQCGQCHNAWSEVTLGFRAEQLNRDVGGENQLVRLSRLGLIERRDKDAPLPPYTAADAAKLPTLAGATVAERARSYLHANCYHCHRFGGGGSADIELDAFRPLAETKTLDARPRAGGFDLTDARIVAPGRPERSVLLYRMAKFGRGRMPHVGSELVDESAVALVAEWIRTLGPPGPTPPGDWRATPSAALLAACHLNDRRAELLAAAKQLPPGAVRDLFDGYLPQTGERKLGPNPDPEKILRLAGDAAKGAALLRSNRVNCAVCHKLDGTGREIGPDLTRIGATRTRRELLESLLEPSKRVEAKYQAHVVTTLDGRVRTGVVARRDVGGLTLLEAAGTRADIAAADVDEERPSPVSLMPAGALADFTAQEAADLLAHLAGRK